MRVIILGVCVIVAASVFAVMFRTLLTFRRSGKPRYFHRSAAMELIWAAIPCLILVACAVPAVKQIMALPDRQAEPTHAVQ